MNARDRHVALEEGDADHQLLLSYLNSSAWEARLVEARAKRQAIVDGLDAGMVRRPKRAEGIAPTRHRPPTPRPVEAPREAIVIAPFARPRAGIAPTAPATRRPYLLRAAALSIVALMAGASVVQLAGGAAETVSPVDIVTRNETGTPSPIAATAKPDPDAASTLTGIETLAASLEEIALTNSVTIVASARQADVLADLDRAKAAASVRVTPFELDRSTVSFYHPGDADAAMRLASRLDGETMDLTGLLPTPPDGTLSVHLAGDYSETGSD